MALAAACVFAASAPAQGLVQRADAFMNAGMVFRAESLYYDAVERSPRDPATRLALGRYLAQRGALQVGAVLMEEARYFGGDSAVVARELAPVYERLGSYAALAALPASPLSAAERSRAEWLRDHPPAVSGPDTGTVAYQVSDSRLLGEVVLRIGSRRIAATIDGRATGLVLDPALGRLHGLRRFGRAARGGGAPAVAARVALGPFVLTNVLASVAHEAVPGRAVIGLDVLGRLAPTFDPVAGRILLRRSGRADSVQGFVIPTLTTERGVFVVKSNSIFPLRHPDVQQYLRRVRWTLDPRQGRLVVEGSDQ